MVDDAAHADVVRALMTEHRTAISELRALCAIYRALLEAAGVAAPADLHGAEALRRYRRAFEAVGFDDPEQHPELIADWWGTWPRGPGELPGGPWAAVPR